MKSSTFHAATGVWDELCRHVLRQDGKERLAFLPVGVRACDDHLDVYAFDVWPVSDKELVGGPNARHVEASPQALVRVVNRAIKLDVGLVEAHNHPHCDESVGFSPSDEQGFDEVVPYMLDSLPQAVYGAFVLGGETSVDGVLWTGLPTTRNTVNQWEAIGSCRRGGTTSSGGQSIALERFASTAIHDRQVRAFGPHGQRQLSALRVAVVGVGGIGSAVVQQMVHLGIRRFTLIDPDLTEMTNLNRLLGATRDDAHRRLPKVQVAARLIQSLQPDAEILALQTSVFHADAVAAVAAADLVVCGTHDSASRFAVNEMSLAYLRPYLDLGTEIDGRNGSIQSIGGRFTFLFPGSGCLLCARAINPFDAASQLRPAEAVRHDLDRGYIRGSGEAAPSVLPLNAAVVSLAMNEVLAWVTGWRKPRSQKLYDGTDGSVCDLLFDRDPTCMACAELLGRGDLARIAQRYASWAA